MAGYEISVPISVSDVTQQTQSLNAGTTFNFASPFARGDIYETETSPVATATSTAAAASGGSSALAETADSGNVSQEKKAKQDFTIVAVIAGVVILVAIFIWKKL